MKKKRTALGVKAAVLVFVLGCSICFFGCSTAQKEEKRKDETLEKNLKLLAEGYREIYESAEQDDELDSIMFQKKIVDYLGEKGYAAVDQNQRINMVNFEQAEAYCQRAEEGKEAEIVLFLVMEQGRIVRYELRTDGEKMNAAVCGISWKEGEPVVSELHEFVVSYWDYTEKGYLFIEEYHPSGYDGAPGQTAFRIRPLDEELRAWNEKYVMPIGYERNNLLITDWDAQDYSQVDFYDLYETCYSHIRGEHLPYVPEEGAEYLIPKKDFEEVLRQYFSLEPEQIQQQTQYDSLTECYRYRPRGLYDCQMPYGPYPEVTACEEMGNGTYKLTVEAVWIRGKTDQACRSEFIMKIGTDGEFQYVSNRVLEIEKDGAVWYQPRLTEEQWKEIYKKSF